MPENPLLAPSTLPAQLPDFARIRDEHLEPALDEGLRLQREAVERIARDPSPATFENTIEPLEASGTVLARVSAVFFTRASSTSTPFIRELEAALAPRLSEHQDAIRLDPRLIDRIEAVHADRARLDPEQRWLVERHRDDALRAGAALGPAEQARLRILNGRLAALAATFRADLVADTADLAVRLTDEEEVAGLSPDQLGTARAAAEDRGSTGWLLPLALPVQQPVLAALDSAATRERLLEASRSRGRRGGAHDTRPTLLEIVRLRAERAELLGFPNHAALVAAEGTIGSAEAVADLLARLVPRAVANARAEGRALGDPAPADRLYRMEQRRRDRFAVDEAALRPFLDADRVLREGVFLAAGRLYGLTFEERRDLAGHHPDVRVFAVHEADGTMIGLYLLDLYEREGKRGGAWMNPLVERAHAVGRDLAVAVNTLNVPKPPTGRPTLLTLSFVRTLFHEFGHALHVLLAEARYPRLAGTHVPRDAVEFPSQVNEHWMLDPEVLGSYARHVDTGEALPSDVADRLRAAERDGVGFAFTERLAAAVLDQAWHRLSAAEADRVDDVDAFEAQALAAAGLDLPDVPPRYSSAFFNHAFGGGYAAAYYAYIWSEVLDADAVTRFEEDGGLTRENGDRFRAEVLGRGGTRDALQSFEAFTGRAPRIEPLLERRGLERDGRSSSAPFVDPVRMPEGPDAAGASGPS